MMYRNLVIVSLIMFLGISCAREEKREARYDPHECPVCKYEKGACIYCESTKKCNFCDGTGKRHTVVPKLPGESAVPQTIIENCPFCKSTGNCTYCLSKGVCWACDGSGKVDSWDFLRGRKKS